MTRNRKAQPECASAVMPSLAVAPLLSPAPEMAELRCGGCPEISRLKHPYRVFISYSHQDRDLATRLRKHLQKEGLFPITDHEIRVGEAFSEEIREMIECAHVFMPLVTPSANDRLWVQQEIGYAAALNVPVCPVAVGNLPSGMAEHIQGIHVAGAGAKPPRVDEVMGVIEQRLTYATVDDLVRRARSRPRQGRYDCALYWTERQELLVALTEAAYRGGCKLVRSQKQAESCDRPVWRLRQYAAFGSFSIPDVGVDSPAWLERDPERYRSMDERRLLRRERQAMVAYANCFGCDLIIDPRIDFKRTEDTGSASIVDVGNQTIFKHSDSRTAFRIRQIIEFIKAYEEDDRVRVVIPAEPCQITTNLIIVGDWYAAEAVVPHYHKDGYERTMFTRHAPTVLNTIERFNQDFQDHLMAVSDATDEITRARNAKSAALRVLSEWLVRIGPEGH